MVQVVTNENIAQLHETGKVDEYVPPVEDKTKDTPPAEAEATPKATETEGTAPKPDEDSDELGDFKVDDKTQKRINARIDKKHAQMKEAEEFAELQYNERKLADKRAEMAEARIKELEAKVQPAPETEVSKPKPKPEDYANVEAYTDALTDWKVDQKFKERETAQAEAHAKAESARIDREFASRVEATIKDIPDYREVVKASEIVMPPYITQFLLESPFGPQLCYQFAKDPDSYEAIGKLSPIKAIAALGKLETKLEKPAATAAAPAKTTEITRAPAPIQPLDTSAATVTKDPAKMTFQELREYERQKAVQKRRH